MNSRFKILISVAVIAVVVGAGFLTGSSKKSHYLDMKNKMEVLAQAMEKAQADLESSQSLRSSLSISHIGFSNLPKEKITVRSGSVTDNKTWIFGKQYVEGNLPVPLSEYPPEIYIIRNLILLVEDGKMAKYDLDGDGTAEDIKIPLPENISTK